MAMEIMNEQVTCPTCGKIYNKRKTGFPISYAELHRETGYTPYCKSCVDNLYSKYLSICDDSAKAVRQVCRKIDLYWNGELFEKVLKRNTTRSVMSAYMSRLATITYAGKSYDDTLLEEGSLWSFVEDKLEDVEEYEEEIADEVKEFWGHSYSNDMYKDLEQRRKYYMSKFPEGTELEAGSEALLRQVCNLEVDIARARTQDKPIDKYINTLNNILGSMNLKPAQTKNNVSSDFTPFGVWIKRLEHERPVAEVDPELRDVDGIIRYISIYFLGHLCKMLNIKNTYSKLYEDELERMRIERPEYEDEDDETMFNDIFGSSGDE